MVFTVRWDDRRAQHTPVDTHAERTAPSDTFPACVLSIMPPLSIAEVRNEYGLCMCVCGYHYLPPSTYLLVEVLCISVWTLMRSSNTCVCHAGKPALSEIVSAAAPVRCVIRLHTSVTSHELSVILL